jgi:hypothetical protein
MVQMSPADAAEKAAGGEDEQSGVQHRLSSPAIGSRAERNLQNSLRQTVGAQRDADQRQVVAALDVRGVHREHRQNEEQPEHAQAEDASEADARAQLDAGHSFIH